MNPDLYSEDLAVKSKRALQRRGIRTTLVDETRIVQSNIDCDAALFYADRSAGLDHFPHSVQNYGSSGNLAYWQRSSSGGGVHRQIPVAGTLAIRRITAQEHGTSQPQNRLVCRLVGGNSDCPTTREQ